jgi:hypothetical protein
MILSGQVSIPDIFHGPHPSELHSVLASPPLWSDNRTSSTAGCQNVSAPFERPTERTPDGLYVAWPASSRATSPYFRTVIPEILNDYRRPLQSWEKAGSLDPFEKIYEVSQLLSPSLPLTGGGTCRKRWPSGATIIPSGSCE